MAEYKTSDYQISDLYQGGYSSMNPPISSSYDQNISVGSLGTSSSHPSMANQLKEVSDKISMGIKNIEVQGVSPQVFDAIPKQQLKEINRLSKLTGIDVSMHGPVMDVAGISEQGFSEPERELAERKVTEALLRAKDLKPDGNIPVVFHSAQGIPASQLLPPSEREKAGTTYQRMIAVNRETGKMIPIETDKEYRPGTEEVMEVLKHPEKRIQILNDTEWKNSMFQVDVNRENAERVLQDIHPLIIDRFAKLETGRIDPRELSNDEISQIKKVSTAFEFVDQARQSADALFSKAYDIAKRDNDTEKIKLLNEASKRYGEAVGIEGDKIKNPDLYRNPKAYSDALFDLTRNLERASPNMYIPLEDFATEKTSQTFGHAAFNAYKQFKGKNVPVTVIENPPAGMGLSTGKDLRNVVEKSREEFVKKAVSEGMSQNRAKSEAEKLIGATWDVGHINMLRGKGYSEEEIVKETEEVKDIVKHVHLSDNFGFEHTELPMGMGNVPLKKMMEKLGEKGYDAKKIIEAGDWWQHFKTSPFQETMEGTGSPIYGMKMAPQWNQAEGLFQGYSSGYGMMLPQTNYETFGAGFSRLPQELGGTAQGGQGNRMSGRPME